MKLYKRKSRKKKKPVPRKVWPEDACRRCGECCRVKVILPDTGEPVPLDSYCPCLNLETKECMVYKDRFDLELGQLREADCLDVYKMIARHEAPPDCPYAVEHGGENYRGIKFNYDRMKTLVPRKERL